MEKIWFKSYDPGTPHMIDPDQYGSLLEIINESFSSFGKQPAFTNFGQSLTYHEVDELSQAFAGFLQKECQLEKGDRVVIMMPNILQFPVAMIGALRAGMIPVNVNPLYTPRELKQVLEDSGAKCIVVLANVAHTVQSAVPNTAIKHIIVTEIGDLFSPIKKRVFNFVVKYIKKMVPEYYISDAISFSKTVKNRYQKYFKPATVSAEDIAFLQYTGGTTGNIKGVMLTHRNMVSNILQILSWSNIFFKQRNVPTIINALPMYHIFSLTANCLLFFKLGYQDVLITNPRDIRAFVKELKHHRFSVFFGVNTLYNLLSSIPLLKQYLLIKLIFQVCVLALVGEWRFKSLSPTNGKN